MRWPFVLSLALAAAVALHGPVRAEDGAAAERPECDVIASFQVENDRIANTDRNYTNGLRLAFLFPEIGNGCWSEDRTADPTDELEDWAAAVPIPNAYPNRRWKVQLGQSLFTPEDTDAERLIVDDRPYAGWLYGGFGVVTFDDTFENFESVNLDVGVVGPLAQGEFVQNEFHRRIGVPEADGWDNQIGNEPGVMLSYERKWRFLAPGDLFGIELDAMPHVGATVGNVMTHAAIGSTVRLGIGLPREDFGPPRIRPSVPGSDFFAREPAFNWYLFAGGEARAVARNIFLDGNTFRGGPSIDKNALVLDFQGGVAASYGRARLVFTTVLRSPEIEGDSQWDVFGSLSLGFRF
jgi:hypothetical protein